MFIYGIRLRLARRIAPAPIMVDPYPGEATVIFIREGRFQATFKAKTFELTTKNRLPQVDVTDLNWTFEPMPVATSEFKGTLA